MPRRADNERPVRFHRKAADFLNRTGGAEVDRHIALFQTVLD